MKIQCDVCEREEATVFCSADEAALCDGCDRRVHRANKLASKHTRYSLLHPSFKDSPLCDICKDRRALLFCREDRAILCRECDIPIHRANEHTQKHSRFLLTGVRLSPSSSSSSSSAVLHHHQQPPPPTSSSTGGLWRQESSSTPKQQLGFANPSFEFRPSGGGGSGAGQEEDESRMVVSSGGSMAASSISEYLMETLPGWRVDEFLDCNSNNNPSVSHGYCKTSDHTLPMPEPDYEFRSDTNPGYAYSRDLPISVPQFFPQPHLHHHHHNLPLQIQTPSFNGVREPEKKARRSKSSRRRSELSQGIHTFAL